MRTHCVVIIVVVCVLRLETIKITGVVYDKVFIYLYYLYTELNINVYKKKKKKLYILHSNTNTPPFEIKRYVFFFFCCCA